MKNTLRVLAANVLMIGAWLAFIRAANIFAFAILQIQFAKSMAEDDAVNVTTKLIPYLKDHPRHYSAYDFARMRLVESQTMDTMLSLINQLFIMAGAWFCIGFLCWLLLRWLFPDRKELLKSGPIPGIPLSWQRPLKLWRSGEAK